MMPNKQSGGHPDGRECEGWLNCVCGQRRERQAAITAAPNIRCSRPGMSWAVCVWNAPGG